MLELDEGKLSRPVLRRGDGSNPGSLAGGRVGKHRLYPEADAQQPPLILRSGSCARLTASVRPLHEGPLRLLRFSIHCNSRCATMPYESQVCLSIAERAYGQEARGKQ